MIHSGVELMAVFSPAKTRGKDLHLCNQVQLKSPFGRISLVLLGECKKKTLFFLNFLGKWTKSFVHMDLVNGTVH